MNGIIWKRKKLKTIIIKANASVKRVLLARYFLKPIDAPDPIRVLMDC